MVNPRKRLPPTIMMAMDLELNQAQTGAKIIEIGIAVGNIVTGEILESKSLYVNPHELLTEKIVKLTGITQDIVDGGTELYDAYQEMVKIHQTHGADPMLLVWGNGDVLCLKEQVSKDRETRGLSDEYRFAFPGRYIDVKTVYQVIRHSRMESLASGLAKSMTKMGLQFHGTKHSGKDDAVNTFRMYRRCLEVISPSSSHATR